MRVYHFLMFLRLMFSIWHKGNWAGKYTTWWEAFQIAKMIWLEGEMKK